MTLFVVVASAVVAFVGNQEEETGVGISFLLMGVIAQKWNGSV